MAPVWNSIFIWILFASVCYALENNNTLRLLQMIFRHGDRAPKILYPKDPNPASIWTSGLAQLTQLGKKQHYMFGKYLRSFYGNFITADPNEVYVDSAYSDRCLISGLSSVASFYVPNERWTFENDFPWQPLAVHYLKPDDDKYLNHDSYCPQDTLQAFNYFESPGYLDYLAENADMVKNLSECSGEDLTDARNMMNFYETVSVERKYGLTILDCIKPFYDRLHVYANQLQFSYANNPVTHRLRAGPFLERLIQNMRKKISGRNPNTKAYLSYSHAENIIIILEALGVFGNTYPPYTSAIAFELHGEQNGRNNTVRMLFWNSTTPETHVDDPHILILDGCGEYCPLDHFLDVATPLIPDDWMEECKVDEPFD